MFGLGQTLDIFLLIIIIICSLILLSLLISVVCGECIVRTRRKKIGNRYGDNVPIDIQVYNKEDDVVLKGWFFKSGKGFKEQKTVIFCHGYGQRRDVSPFYIILRGLLENGYNVLSFDFRRCGESTGKTITVSIKETNDLEAVIKFAKDELKQDKIALLGYSMGAVTALRTGFNQDVSCVIADSPFSNLYQYLLNNLSKWSKLPKFPFTYIILGYFRLRIGFDIRKVDIINDVKKYLDKPLFLIHSKGDFYIDYHSSEEIFNAREGEKTEIWIGEDSKHCEMCKDHEEEYVKKICGFLERSM